ncbi:hypothetical protein ANTQUA_LOCUS3471 [Anthophora quadrimaculata]
MVATRCTSDTCFRLVEFENQNSTTVAYSTWDYRRNGSIQVLSIVLVLRVVLRLFCLSRTVIEARCASDTRFRLEAFENQNSTTVAYSTWDYRRNGSIQNRGCSEMCFRHVLSIGAIEKSDSTTVVYSTWYCRRNTSIQVFSIVIVLRIELLQYYLHRSVVVAKFASDTSFRLEAFENQDSTTVAYSAW